MAIKMVKPAGFLSYMGREYYILRAVDHELAVGDMRAYRAVLIEEGVEYIPSPVVIVIVNVKNCLVEIYLDPCFEIPVREAPISPFTVTESEFEAWTAAVVQQGENANG